jgi:S1-C subfamily serine protease
MGAFSRLSILGCVLAAAGMAGAARAEEWVPAARTTAGDVFEVDLASAGRNGQIAQSWVRETLVRPMRDNVAGKSYVTELDQRFDDCQNRRFRIDQATRRDKQGRVVSTGQVATGWHDFAPETVAEGIWRVACRIGEQPSDKPLLDNISEGRWVRVGLSGDKKYYFSIRFDRLVKVDADHVIAVSRSDYVDFDQVHGYPVKYMIQGNIIDCRQAKTALWAVDSYMAAEVRAESYRTPAAALKFEPVAPGSFLAGEVQEICASAPPPPKQQEAGAQPGDVFTGTAWGVAKGYLVTASHVIKDGRKIEVYSEGQPVGTARVVTDDPANDVAILKLTQLHPQPLIAFSLADHTATLGRSVFTLGYPAPDILGQHVKMTAGEVSATAGAGDDARFLQISVPIQPGNSGGPIIDWEGEVVGVARSTIGAIGDEPAQNVNYAVKASYVRAMLEDLPDLGSYILVRPTATHEEMVTAARKAVFMLVVTQ